MTKRRVVITGIGMLSPVGNDVKTAWDNIVAGKSGIGVIRHFDTDSYSVRIAGAVKDFDVGRFLSPKESRRMDTFIQYGIAAGVEAFEDSGLVVSEDNAHRFGVAVGSGIGGLGLIENNHKLLMASGPRKVSPFLIPGSIINMVAGNLSIRFGLKGPNIAISTACTSGVHNIGVASRMIQYGDADVMLAGGAECGSTPLGIAGFASSKALSCRNDAPEQASRPWDKDRDGFVLGDGAGVLVLEAFDQAKKRGAKIYAEVVGFGMSADAFHITSPPEDGSGAALAMQNALSDAKISADQVDYINAHGTSTVLGDRGETRAVHSCFGALAKDVAVSSTKSMTGHLLGAAGAVESIFSALAICDQVAPPTINLDEPGEGCDLDYVPHTAREMGIDVVLCNSFGFGGTNGSLVLRKV